MVSDNHQVADFEISIRAAAGIGYKQCLDTQLTHHTYGESHLFHRITLVIMETALHSHDIFITQFTEDELTAMPFYGRYRKVGNIRIVYFILFGNFVG